MPSTFSTRRPPGPPRRSLACRLLSRGCAACGLFAGRLGLLNSARGLLGRAVILDPQSPLGHRGLGNLLRRSGQSAAAATRLRRAVRLRPHDARAWFGLGLALRRLGHPDQALGCFQKTLAFAPNHAEAAFCIGNAYARRCRLADASYYLHRAVTADFYMVEAHNNLGCVLEQQGRTHEACDCLRRVLALDPGHAVARHHLAALSGCTTASAPLEYVRHLFDGYAPYFDRHLVEVLHYRAPAVLRRQIDACPSAPATFDQALDLGCGTGLSGQAFRDRAGHLTGIDISAKMIDEARGKGLYDELHVTSLTDFLARTDRRFDLFVAADVLIYIGNLSPVFNGLRRCCRPGARFVFSTEQSTAPAGYALQPNGRYVHSAGYIARLAAHNGARVESVCKTVIRRHEDQDVPGQAHVLRLA